MGSPVFNIAVSQDGKWVVSGRGTRSRQQPRTHRHHVHRGPTPLFSSLSSMPYQFRGRCIEKLEKLGDTARDSKKHDKAVGYYSDALSLDPTNLNDLLLKHGNQAWIVFHVTSNGPR